MRYKWFHALHMDVQMKVTFKKLPPVKFRYSTKEEYSQLFEKATKIHFPLYKARFYSFTSTKTSYNKLNPEAN